MKNFQINKTKINLTQSLNRLISKQLELMLKMEAVKLHMKIYTFGRENFYVLIHKTKTPMSELEPQNN